MKFNHVANRVDTRHFDTIVTMMTDQLDFAELRRTDRSIWLRQAGASVDLQFSRSETLHRDADKRRSQVSFLSTEPREALAGLAAWLLAHGLKAEIGSYSKREFYLDVPDAFVDFVVEAMRPELADYGSRGSSP